MGHFGMHPSPSISSHGTVGWDGMGWDGMGWDGQWGQGVVSGTLWYDPSLSILSHGIVGWDGQWGQGIANGTLWYASQSVHFIPWYSGMGWDGMDSGDRV